MPTSIKSTRSKMSYKSKGGSYVDQTLFSSPSKQQQSQFAKAGASILSINDLRKVREQTEKGLQKDAIILPREELDRIRLASKIVSKDQEKQEKQLYEEQKEKQRVLHNAKKKRMLQMDRERANKLPPSEFQVEDRQQKEGLLKNAQEMFDEEKDDVKTMNQMLLYSK